MVAAMTLVVALAFAGCVESEQALPKDRLVATIRAAGGSGPYELVWAKTAMPWNEQEMFVTLHRGRDGSGYVAAAYRRIGQGFEMLVRLHTDSSELLEPRFARTVIEGGSSPAQLFAIREVFSGTGGSVTEHVYLVQPDGRLEPVEFIPAPRSFASHLRPGEEVWKGEQNEFNDQVLAFTFYIWRKGDTNCCPSGGKVTGRYVLRRANGTYQIAMRTFERSSNPVP